MPIGGYRRNRPHPPLVRRLSRRMVWKSTGAGTPVGPESAMDGVEATCGRQWMDSMNLLRRWFSSSDWAACVAILLTEWMTVEWCLPPNFLPMSGKEDVVIFLQRYIATCRGKATTRELFRAFRSATFR